MNILISPHDDDSHLFACYTLLRERPLVVVCLDSYIQPNRGDVGCTAEVRAFETKKAHEITENPVMRLGLRDDTVTEDDIRRAFQRFSGFEKVYAPAIQEGNWQHDMISKVAREVFGNITEYTTYTKTELWTKGNVEVVPTEEERALKNLTLDCYKSQIDLSSTRPHFDAVKNQSEWLN